MRQVAGVNDKLGCGGQRVDFVHRRLQCRSDVRMGGLVEACMAVADLDEAEISFPAMCVFAKGSGARNAAGDCPDDACSGPGHAVQESAAVDTVVAIVVREQLFQVVSSGFSPFTDPYRGVGEVIPGGVRVCCVISKCYWDFSGGLVGGEAIQPRTRMNADKNKASLVFHRRSPAALELNGLSKQGRPPLLSTRRRRSLPPTA